MISAYYQAEMSFLPDLDFQDLRDLTLDTMVQPQVRIDRIPFFSDQQANPELRSEHSKQRMLGPGVDESIQMHFSPLGTA